MGTPGHVFEESPAGESGRAVPGALASSSISGANVVDVEGDDLGRIEDLVVDVRDGRILYAVLSFGGFLGLADKLFAVPWEALRVDPERQGFLLGIPKQALQGAPGFDKDHWPDMADERFRHAVRAHYGPDRFAAAGA